MMIHGRMTPLAAGSSADHRKLDESTAPIIDGWQLGEHFNERFRLFSPGVLLAARCSTRRAGVN